MFTAPDARADNECGPPEREVVCSPSTYDPAQGNIFYSHDENGMDETTSDLFIRLAEDLSINYDRERPGDDVYTSPYDNRVRFNNAVWIAPGEFGEYAGDVSLYSSADIASNARGIFAGHYGKSGALHMEVSGGEITTTGEVSHAVRGFRFDGSDGALDLIVRGVSIDTTGNNADGVSAAHWGQGVLNLIAQDSAVTTEGDAADGVYAFHAGAGDVNIAAKDLDITTKGDNAFGIVGAHESEGDLNLTARDSAVTTEGDSAYVVYALHAGAGDVNIAAKDLDITTKGDNAFGVVGAHENEGDLNLTARDSAVTTEGDSAYVVYARHEGAGDVNIATRGLDINTAGDSADGLLGWHQGTGELKMDVQDFAIETAGDSAHGLIGWHQGAGDLNITAQGVSITTAGEGARGIYGGHFFMEGDAAVRVHDSAISTAGAKAHGVYAFHTGAGVLEVDLRDMTIAATGAGADGIVSDHGGSGSAHMMIEGGSVHAAGAGASGVRMGRLAEDGTVSFAALVGEDGYRKQSVEVNAPVTGGSGENAAGVFLAGGGKVAIGPEGSVGAASGIAILASGGLPRLRVEMDLDGRWAGSVLQEGSIINDAGETTLVVNGVTLHEGATGATGAEVANGAWDLTLSETVQGRAFTPGDFIESYAPRAAVYEALPGSLLRLEGGRPSGRRVAQSGSPVWARISGGRGSYEPRRASTGASYEFRRFAAEAGVDFRLSEAGDVTGSASLCHARESAEVSAPTGGGKIGAEGVGVSLGAAWATDAGYYADGRVTLTRYEADLSSSSRGRLKEGATATVRTVRLEAGRRLALGETMHLAPRGWLVRTDVSLDGFGDAVGSRVSLDEAGRTDVGIGIVADSVHAWDAGERTLTLRGELGVERTPGGAATVVEVSGERLRSETTATRVKLGLGGAYRWGRYTLSGAVSGSGPGSGDSEYTAGLRFGMRF